MANKDKILLLAMISMMLPGAMPDAFADNVTEPETKPAKRSHAPKTKTSNGGATARTERGQKQNTKPK